MRCIKCGKELPDHARFCKYCGAEQVVRPEPAKPAKKKKSRLAVITIIAVLIVLGISGYLHFSGKAVPEMIQEMAGTAANEEIPPEILVSYAAYDPEGELYYNFIYKYSDDGLRLERTGLTRDHEKKVFVVNSPEYYELYKPYDPNKFKSRKTYDKNGALVSEEVYSSDRKTNTGKYYSDKGLTEVVQKYDENGHRVLYRQTLNGELVGETIYKYSEDGTFLGEEVKGEKLVDQMTDSHGYSRKDENGNVIANCTIATSPQGEKVIWTYYRELDQYGNPQKAVSYHNGKLVQVIVYQYRTADELDEEINIPEKREITESVYDESSMFEEEIRQSE